MLKKTTLLRQMMEEKTVIAVGVYDAFTAILLQKTGIDVAYVSGYITTASFLGQPDLGLMTYAERLMISRQINRRVDLPVIADIEGGYGNVLNVIDTVEQFESAGLAGIQLDDEVMPTKCQSFASSMYPNELISVEEMCNKIRATVDTRQDPDFLIMVRSNVIGSVVPGSVPKKELIHQIAERVNAYSQAGADIAFVYASSTEELELYAKLIHTPLAGLLGYSAPLSIENFRSYGYKLVILPIHILPCAAKAILQMLECFQEKGEWKSIKSHVISHDELKDILMLKKYVDLAKKYQI
jgi:2-methylisocitrate lyase-like PEP mutase family enzyme